MDKENSVQLNDQEQLPRIIRELFVVSQEFGFRENPRMFMLRGELTLLKQDSLAPSAEFIDLIDQYQTETQTYRDQSNLQHEYALRFDLGALLAQGSIYLQTLPGFDASEVIQIVLNQLEGLEGIENIETHLKNALNNLTSSFNDSIK